MKLIVMLFCTSKLYTLGCRDVCDLAVLDVYELGCLSVLSMKCVLYE